MRKKYIILSTAFIVVIFALVRIMFMLNTNIAEQTERRQEAQAKLDMERYLAMTDKQLMQLFELKSGLGLTDALAAIAAGVCNRDCNRFLSELIMNPGTDLRILIELVDATDKIDEQVYLKALYREKIELLHIMLFSGKYQPDDCKKLNEKTLEVINDPDSIILLAKLVRERGDECLSPFMLHIALGRGNIETANWLINEGVEVDRDVIRSYMAGANTSFELLATLVAKGADLNNKVSGNTPLDRVLIIGDEGVTMREVRLWMSFGAQAKPGNLEIFQEMLRR